MKHLSRGDNSKYSYCEGTKNIYRHLSERVLVAILKGVISSA